MQFTSYQEYVDRLPISKHTRRLYLTRVRLFLQWLEGTVDGSKAFDSAVERDFFVRDYKVFLLQNGLKPATVNASLAALDNLFTFIGLGPAKIKRQDLPALSPRSLEADDLRRVIKAIAQCGSLRNKTLCMLLMHSGLRISEVAGLDVADVALSARKGELRIRNGKGNRHRVVPINSDLREILQVYMNPPRLPSEPLFVSKRGTRISVSSIDHLVRAIGRDAGISLHCHAFRHTVASKLLKSGLDIVTVAEICGHQRIETTRRYALPTVADKINAMERLNFDPAS